MSFVLMIVVMVVTASVAVAWSMTHIVVLLVDIGLIAGLRELVFFEGRHRG